LSFERIKAKGEQSPKDPSYCQEFGLVAIKVEVNEPGTGYFDN
jgi:hypothetical protein